MKKCPFCAEEIQDAAIKCRYCNSFLSAAPASPENETAPSASSQEPVRARSSAETSAAERLLPTNESKSEATAPSRKILYQGFPSWRAFLKAYSLIVVGALTVPYFSYWLASKFHASGFTKFLAFAIPFGMAAIAFLAVNIYRRSKVVRVTSSNIELETGLMSRKIDVLELWRCRDIQYRQSFADRILHVAHVDIYTTDVTTPNVCIVGLPASRELFENIRDAIEIQRQSRNVVGMVS